ncbi:ComEA family DNA-binding protein [Aequorivita echinoideorum]|uniref:Helix-hairpin-helix domain-containing protein n=1 Tax=Aequorivita echinoideorum TaxID=1549647 RepID=A0ABS5S6X9_9FLAO|nr:helix-hairpin-helix domain-containing protein [Aequorivita echinoideorum]MBT0608974.1 helix-hairpin-helix domain-containing protein [Aequorivita echinoideorum]
MKQNSHFSFNRQQRSGILFLLFLLIGLLCLYFFVDFSEESSFDTSSSEIVALQKQIDSLQVAEIENRKPKRYPFNPNFITDYKGYTLGMTSEEIDLLLAYRKDGKWINSAADFKKVTGISDSLLAEISPLFKFPDWVTNPKNKSDFKKFKDDKGFSEKTYAQKIDLNKATSEELQKVSGIGEVLAGKIISHREKLKGFSDDNQLYDVYGLDPAVVMRTLNLFTVKTPREIVKMNLNKATASDIATIPNVSFDLAKKIWEYRILHEKVQSFQELDKIPGITERKLQVIQLYLFIE